MEKTEDEKRFGIIPDRYYNVLKWLAAVVIPAFATFVIAMDQIWNIGLGDKVYGTITAVNALIGALLGMSTYKYNRSYSKYDGVLNVVRDEGLQKDIFDLALNTKIADLPFKKDVTFKVDVK